MLTNRLGITGLVNANCAKCSIRLVYNIATNPTTMGPILLCIYRPQNALGGSEAFVFAGGNGHQFLAGGSFAS